MGNKKESEVELFDGEVFKIVPGFNGRYEASSLGRIIDNKFGRSKCRSIIQPRLSQNGYLRVSIYIDGERKTWPVHRFVCLAFHDNPFKYKVINHKDGIKTNNRVENLEWCSMAYNIQHSFTIKPSHLRPSRKGEKSGYRKLKNEDVLMIRRLENYLPTEKLCEIFGVRDKQIRAIIRRDRWTHI